MDRMGPDLAIGQSLMLANTLLEIVTLLMVFHKPPLIFAAFEQTGTLSKLYIVIFSGCKSRFLLH